MKESVLILGASLMQKPAILAAKSLGMKVYAIDANENALCVSLADCFKKIDLKDKEKILEYATELKEKQNLCGIFTAGTDFSSSVSYAAEKLGFPCHSYESTLNASIKNRMRKCFALQGVASPKFYTLAKNAGTEDELYSDERAIILVQKLGFPCVVKPVDSMGARGCRMIRSEDEILPSVESALESSRTQTIILEEYLDGKEFSIDAIIYDGTFTVTGFADRHIFYEPYFIEMGHTMPSTVDEKTKLELIKMFKQGCDALGLTCGVAKADIKYTKDGAVVGEIAARLSGGYMSGWTFPYSADFDLTKAALQIACNKNPVEFLEARRYCQESSDISIQKQPIFSFYEIPSQKVSSERAYISIPGVVKKIHGLKHSSKIKHVKNIFPRTKIGDTVDFPRNNVQKCGNIITVSKDYKKAVEQNQKAISKIIIELEKNNPETDAFLNQSVLPSEKNFPPSAYSAYEKVKNLSLQGEIPKNKRVLDCAPDEIKPFLSLPEKSWNNLTALEACKKFDKLQKKHPPLNQQKFWNALFRGGVQGALYIC